MVSPHIAGEQEQCAAGHGNDAVSLISNQRRGLTAVAARPDQEEEEDAAAPTGLNPL